MLYVRNQWFDAIDHYDRVLIGRLLHAWQGYLCGLKTERALKFQRLSALSISYYKYVCMQAIRTPSIYAMTYIRRKLIRKVWRGFKMHRKMLKTKAIAVTGHFSRFERVVVC